MAPVMGFTVLLSFLVTTLTSSRGSQVYSEIRYECGPHGKFEYCVDDIPSCVVGCHCHPGYYFDTETKICELNVKLTQHSRQHYLAEPIRGYDPPAITTTELPFPTATAYSDEKDYEIKKDTDEIGDWLYNQFFKAIENQVISNSNNTKPISNVKLLTRRSEGSGPVINEIKKKKRKSNRSHRKRKHMKGRRLKKLLRITEDDSLFDSDSDSESGYSDSDSYSDYSDDSSDESTYSSDERKSSGTDSSEHKDHGHKKVVIFNRRPKPPLPSFIFVPSVDTPFYPPIGLPPPPLLPMLPMPMVPPPPPPPMIPLPPPPMIPLPPMIPTPPAPPPHSTEPPKNKKDANIKTTTTKGPDTNGRRDRLVKPQKKPNLVKTIGRANEPGKHKNLKRISKNRLIQKIMEKLKIKRRNNSSPSDARSLEEFQDQDFQDIDDIPNSLEFYTPHKRSPKKDQDEDHMPELEDVDFKYLSELIHGVNKSTAKRRSPFNLNDDVKGLHKRRLISHPSRRNFDSDNLMPQVHTQSTDDIYYSNLGRQMASMVRNADAEIFPEYNKNLEHVNRQVPFHSVLNENSHFPRSLWERSVRSLLPRHGPFSEYLDESRTLKHSNEKSLINLENEVAIVASTPRPMSLQDLENILSTMQKVHANIKFRKPLTSTKQSNVSLNVNLLPKHVRSASANKILFEAPIKVEYQTELPRVYLKPIPTLEANTTSLFYEPEKKYNIPYKDYWLSNLNVEPIEPKIRPRPVFDQTSKPTILENQTYNPYSIRQTFVDIVQPKPTEAYTPREQYLQFQNSVPLAKQTIPKINEAKIVKYKSLNYFSDNNHYLYEADSYPLLTPFKSQISKRINKPSYFHHHLHHFEYFD